MSDNLEKLRKLELLTQDLFGNSYFAQNFLTQARERVEMMEDTVEKFASVTLFKPSGKYYTSESWRIPNGAIGPHDMVNSPDFRRIGDSGAVLVESEPHSHWGFPCLL